MTQSQAWGLFGAAFLGTAAGVMTAPQAGRNELRRRAYYNLGDFGSHAARVGRAAAAEVKSLLHSGGGVAANVLASLQASTRPIAALKRSLTDDPILGRRPIWVDAQGETILLHGVVESDEEWRTADCLARAASPDGSVRNLLQVRRSQES
ncbi:MAG: BON domain-containing protein [Candidatus Eremiobacteraeota bacterium]|nr:BON domain-containing protein [Candidatus Eremiobacteraeota bacterium]MBC5826370.1 BON domain-containing protein [Candidatus Eremiobacteraeota bacterium]